MDKKKLDVAIEEAKKFLDRVKELQTEQKKDGYLQSWGEGICVDSILSQRIGSSSKSFNGPYSCACGFEEVLIR